MTLSTTSLPGRRILQLETYSRAKAGCEIEEDRQIAPSLTCSDDPERIRTTCSSLFVLLNNLLTGIGHQLLDDIFMVPWLLLFQDVPNQMQRTH